MQTSDTESCEIIHDYRTSTTGGGNASGANSMDSRGHQQPHQHHHHHHHSHHSSSLTHGSPRFRNRNQQQQQQLSRLVGSKKSSNETSSNIEADEDLRLSNEAVYRGRGRDSDDMLDDDEEPDEVEEEEEEEEESEVESEEDEEEEEEAGRQFRRKPRAVGMSCGERRPSDAVTRNYISDELKYGAGHNRGTPAMDGRLGGGGGGQADLSHHNNSHSSHHNHQSLDSNPVESQSEWSDDECREEPTGGAESTGYITDEPGLENISLLNEAGLTDAEGALSDVNSLYNAPDVDDTSISSRASSRLLSLDSLSGLYDCDLDSRHEMAIVSASHKISSKFGPATTTTTTTTNGSSG